MVISHIKPPQAEMDSWTLQSNKEHMAQVAALAASFANEFGLSEWARVAALLHDKGKEQAGFQSYIKCVSGYDTATRTYTKTPHAYVGALIAKELFPYFYLIISPTIIAHHRGLYDTLEFMAKMQSEIPQGVTVEPIDATLSIPPQFLKSPSEIHHVIRMLFSCLVDADYLDTEAFMDERKARLRGSKATIAELLPKLEHHLAALKKEAKDTPLNKIRNDIQQLCSQRATEPCGFYSLSVPTGGGKTLSSLLWAMHHAIQHHKRRVIIAIPYTSIITQTAAILRSIFGDENVLEHHSSIDHSEKVTDTEAMKRRLASENWDAPIVVTTNVQLFESIYSNRPSTCRKLHNICNSVLILDEVQVLPLEHLQPIIDSLVSYQQVFGVSVLFTTASLPALRNSILEEAFKVSNKKSKSSLKGFEKIEEIIPESLELHKQLQRTELHFDEQDSSYDEVAQRLATHPRVLCIVNTRRDALEIFNRLPPDDNTYHLSRMMCSKHIAAVIQDIKGVLRQDATTPIRVVSTQLIEAGVDIDFPVVYRQEAGLDSILQAAGRCNREGSIEGLAPVHIFKLDKPLPRGFISQGVSARKGLKEVKDWYASTTMTNYFIQLYSKANTFDKAKIEEMLHDPTDTCFETASRSFQLIEQQSRMVIVNYKDSSDLITALRQEGCSYALMKKLYRYSVNLRECDFKRLVQSNLLEEILPDIYFLPDRAQYNAQVGLQIESHFLEELLIT